MTDITDQDRRDAREWANWASTYADRSMAKAAARVILATVDAPEPTLADEIRGLPDFTMSGENCINDCHERADTLASRVDQMEHDLAEARAEVERLTAEWDEITADRDRLAASNYILGAKAGAATVAREENVAPDQQGDTIPDPADVPEGQAWAVSIDDMEETAGFKASGFGWICYRELGGPTKAIPSDRITLVSRLVPEPRVITDTEELEAMPSGAVIRDSAGVMFQRIVHGWYQAGDTSVHRSDDNFICLPVTVLWEPEA